MNVAVLGASAKPARYSHQAMKLLAAHGHTVFPVNPAGGVFAGFPVFRCLSVIAEPVNTITVYLSARNSASLRDKILAAVPHRVIFNPGTENSMLAAELKRNGIEVVEGCTLVMLTTNQF